MYPDMSFVEVCTAAGFVPVSDVHKSFQLVSQRARYFCRPNEDYSYVLLRYHGNQRDYALLVPDEVEWPIGSAVIFRRLRKGLARVEVVFPQSEKGSAALVPFPRELKGIGLTMLVARKSILYEYDSKSREWVVTGYDGNRFD